MVVINNLFLEHENHSYDNETSAYILDKNRSASYQLFINSMQHAEIFEISGTKAFFYMPSTSLILQSQTKHELRIDT